MIDPIPIGTQWFDAPYYYRVAAWTKFEWKACGRNHASRTMLAAVIDILIGGRWVRMRTTIHDQREIERICHLAKNG